MREGFEDCDGIARSANPIGAGELLFALTCGGGVRVGGVTT
jgi:hypothetical protein